MTNLTGRLRPLRLGINVDHVATVRNARGGQAPSPVRAAQIAAAAGADGITAHLREDRRHIRDADISRIKNEVHIPLNFEMAATDEMVRIAVETQPHAACLVPEKREELTTEGGLDAAGQHNRLKPIITALGQAGCRVSLFIEADPAQIRAAKALGAPVVELHTGTYCETEGARRQTELERIQAGAREATSLGIECHAGHGLNFDTVGAIASIPEIVELNIGHFLIGEAIFLGLEGAIHAMRKRMNDARGAAA